MPDEEPVWITPPVIVRAPYLRWAMFRGETLEGICWALREETDGSSFHVLHLAEHATTAELVEVLTPIVGRPIADTLADLAAEGLPTAVSS